MLWQHRRQLLPLNSAHGLYPVQTKEIERIAQYKLVLHVNMIRYLLLVAMAESFQLFPYMFFHRQLFILPLQ